MVKPLGMQLKLTLLASAALLGLSGCGSVSGPEYTRPDSPVKETWQGEQVELSASETVRPDWWREFGDSYLDKLVEQAISGNYDIKVLAARIEVSKEGGNLAGAAAKPTVLGGAGADYTKHTGIDASTRYSLASSVDWELDIWGKVAKGVAAQEAEYKATEADWRAGYLKLVSDVATNYFLIRTLDEQNQRQRNSIDTNQRILSTYEQMYREGIVPEITVMRQRSELANLQSGLLELQRQRKITENRLATLAGKPAGDFHIPPGDLQTKVNSVKVPTGLPSDLLSRRPDIIAAEYRVLRAHNLVGQARLARLPSISLTGRLGTSSFGLTDLLKSWTFGLLPSVSIPLFDPTIEPRIKITKAEAKLAAEEYRGVVVRAFEEVESTLTNLDLRKKQRTELQQRASMLRSVADQVQKQQEEGLVSQLEVFEAERSLLSSEQELLTNYQQLLADTVTLYKAMGGGWPVNIVGSIRK